MEKCIVNPRHIEVQILADKHGNMVHLFERDCSIQRRNQKLIEIAPSPQLTPEERTLVCEHAVNAAKAVNYQNAGTVEFLLDDKRNFYFMEMNTRLQVEHTVTEQVTGMDIVQEQIRIAAGAELSMWQGGVSHRGYAIEMRINAEDPKNNFLPSFGRITRYYAPGGPGVRTDGAIYTGYTIPPYYDSMCAKVTAWALRWPSVIKRSQRALDDIRLSGIKTTIPYYRQILSHPDFRNGSFDTGFVEAHPELLNYPKERPARRHGVSHRRRFGRAHGRLAYIIIGMGHFDLLWWHWIILGTVLLIADAFFLNIYYLIWFGLGALSIGLVLLVAPDIPMWGQIAVFGVLSPFFWRSGFFICARAKTPKHWRGEKRNRRANCVAINFNNGEGKMRLQKPIGRRDVWKFKSSQAVKPGDRVSAEILGENGYVIAKKED